MAVRSVLLLRTHSRSQAASWDRPVAAHPQSTQMMQSQRGAPAPHFREADHRSPNDRAAGFSQPAARYSLPPHCGPRGLGTAASLPPSEVQWPHNLQTVRVSAWHAANEGLHGDLGNGVILDTVTPLSATALVLKGSH